MSDREAMKLALEALMVAATPIPADRHKVVGAIEALRTALAAPRPEPGFWGRSASRQLDINKRLEKALIGCVEHMEHSNPQGRAAYLAAREALRTTPPAPRPEPVLPEAITCGMPFVIKHYTADLRPTIKGNGFDGLEIGISREEAEEFVAWVNARIAAPPAAAPDNAEALRRDAERYRWLRGEHSRIDPCIKANAKYRLERQSSTWVNIHDLDAAIDAAMQEDKT